MTRNELHVLARQAMRDTNTSGDDTLTPWMVRFVERFGRLVAEEEREACAKEVEDWLHGDWHLQGVVAAARIRGRGKHV
jgi:hypothetical protein